MLNSVKINHLYSFEFNPPFDTINGVYKVLAVYSYTDLLNMNIDIKKDTYDAIGIDEATFNNHVNQFMTSQFIKLEEVGVDEPKIYYIPEFVISKEPNFSLLHAYDLGLAIKLGTFINKTKIEDIKNEIEQLILARLGITTNAVIYTINELLITETDWNTIEANRNANIENNDTIYARLVKLQEENLNLKNKIDALEQIIVQISTP